jgi:hypothetical protein
MRLWRSHTWHAHDAFRAACQLSRSIVVRPFAHEMRRGAERSHTRENDRPEEAVFGVSPAQVDAYLQAKQAGGEA